MPPPWLVTVPAQVDTSTPLSNKWRKGTTPVPAVSKLPIQFQIPAFSSGSWKQLGYSLIVCQFNYSLPDDFTIAARDYSQLNFDAFSNGIALVIRYRIDKATFRRQLNLQPEQNEFGIFTIPCPMYNGEVIKKNFVIEVWTPALPVNISNTPIFITTPINITTSILQLSGTSPVITPAEAIVSNLHGYVTDINDLFFAEFTPNIAYPLLLPPSGPWLDNT